MTAAEATADTASESGGRPRPLRVLCVDDNADAADTLKVLVGLYGYEAAACYDAASAIALAEVFRPDVCLLDLNMPGMDGIALARWLAEQAAGRPLGLVAVTAMAGDEPRRRTAAAGFRRHLTAEPGGSSGSPSDGGDSGYTYSGSTTATSDSPYYF